jgi:RNA polymerase sigma-70 factor, ECF subfamily
VGGANVKADGKIAKLDQKAVEAELSALLAQGHVERAATLALRSYGREMLTLISAIHRDPDDADDVFALFCEDLWKGLPRFQGRSALRTWAYTLARHACFRYLRERRGKREVHLTSSAFAKVAVEVRTTTRTRFQRQAHDKLQELRETLPPDDQMLLILRVERELDWKDLARIMAEADLDDKELVREAARLRKRFQLVKDRLRELAAKES